MNILLIGSGGREHALAWTLAQSPSLDTLYASPGNPGIAEHATCVALDPADHGGVLEFCRERGVALVVIGPEGPLIDGLADSLRSGGIGVFGPGRAAAQIEGSKGFTKDLCRRAGIPTAAYKRFTQLDDAVAGLTAFGLPVVIKADGLAAGKGVVIAETTDAARAALADMFQGAYGDAGASVVVEAFLEGEEVSFFALTDGQTVMPFGSAQDHKRVGEGEAGPNTGGMGAYSPASIFTPEIQARVLDTIIQPTVDALNASGTPFCGVLFAGLMLTSDGPMLIEFNARFGDPETQALLMRFEGDLAQLLMACAVGRLQEAATPVFSGETSVTVVVAARGYPGKPITGGYVGGIEAANNNHIHVFQAGTRRENGMIAAVGGRVLAVTALGNSVSVARARAYDAISILDFADGFVRRDIGWREVEREAASIKSNTD